MSSYYFDIRNTITKSNQLIESSHKLTLQQQKIICAVASKVRIHDAEFTEYAFHMKELAELLELNKDGYYTEIRKVIRSLQTQVFTINKIVNGEVKSVDINWFYRAEYNETKNTVSLKFAEDLKPFLIHLNDNFTSYQLKNVVKLDSSYSLRVYEILKSKGFMKGKAVEVSLIELYRMTLNPYPRYADFKRNVLERCKVELKEKTDISFDFREIKTGRKVTSIKFYIKDNRTIIKAIDEVTVALEEEIKEPLQDLRIKQVKNILSKHIITGREASYILKDSNSNLDLIKQCYEYLLTKDKVDNVVGYMRKLVKGFSRPQGNIKIDSFNDYPQRTYDFDDLERKLLGRN